VAEAASFGHLVSATTEAGGFRYEHGQLGFSPRV
jgi:hypothetical protein